MLDMIVDGTLPCAVSEYGSGNGQVKLSLSYDSQERQLIVVVHACRCVSLKSGHKQPESDCYDHHVLECCYHHVICKWVFQRRLASYRPLWTHDCPVKPCNVLSEPFIIMFQHFLCIEAYSPKAKMLSTATSPSYCCQTKARPPKRKQQ